MDYQRLAFFRLNAGWTDGAKQAVLYAVSFARRYAEQGDHEVSAAALNAIIAINTAYVQAKGKTFFSSNPMFDNPLVTDGFINDTLEHLRQTARIGVSRGDEQQIEQSLRAMRSLATLYLSIDYGSERASKTHAHLAAGYLSGEVERIAPHNMPDVLMEGVRLMGQCADAFLAAEGPRAIQTMVQKIGMVSCAGIVREDYRPVTSTGVEQLARLSFDLLRTKSRDVRYAAKQMRSTMAMVAKLFLQLPDSPHSSTHSTYLGPYYSALSARLTQLATAVVDAGEDDANARQVIENFKEWADGIYETEKELLLEAVSKRSQFTSDIIYWITQVTSLLLALSNANACSGHNRDKLRHHALWLISTLSFVPGDEDTVRFIENFQTTETLFDAAVDARHRDCAEVATKISDLLLSWTFKGGRFQTGWATLERGIYGAATLALADGQPAITKLKADVAARLAAGALPDQELRDHSAREIRGRAQTLYQEGHWGSSIEVAMAHQDRQQLQTLLEEIADVISPGTAGQAVTHGMF